MIFCYPDTNAIFDTDNGKVNTLVIENQRLFRSLIEDICAQIEGNNGKAVISSNGVDCLDFRKCSEIITSVVPFDINRKSLISKIVSAVEKESISEAQYEKTMTLLGAIECYLDELTTTFDCNLAFSKITPTTLIKAAGLEIVDDYVSVAEKVIDYLELVREFDRDKLFFTVNFRSFIEDKETDEFMKTIIGHGFNLIMIENKEYKKLASENRVVIDEDLCEI